MAKKNAATKAGRYTVETDMYQGRPVLRIKDGNKDRFPFSFGLGKAKKIVANIAAIEEFVKEQLKQLEQQAKAAAKKGKKTAAK